MMNEKRKGTVGTQPVAETEAKNGSQQLYGAQEPEKGAGTAAQDRLHALVAGLSAHAHRSNHDTNSRQHELKAATSGEPMHARQQ